jgi:hypothetical protein
MLLAYLRHAEAFYVKNGEPTSEPTNIALAFRPLCQLYGHSFAKSFGPLALKAVRQAMIDSGLCRNEVNTRAGKIVRAFKWAVGEEMLPSVAAVLPVPPLGSPDPCGIVRGPVRDSPPV